MAFFRRYTAFTAFALVTAATTALLTLALPPSRAFLAGYDCGALAFLIIIAIRFNTANPAAMRSKAVENEPDHAAMVAIALLVVAVIFVAVWVELSGRSGRDAVGISLAAATLILAWLFANTLFASHYAHVWYLPAETGSGDLGGLDFPGGDTDPDYWDFSYYAFVLGMTFQVSDVEVTSKRLRRLTLGHAVLAFFFNIAVVAISINLVASVLGG
ncbi:membrane protein [Polymorphobacter glacialis]|uniref:Membrane protein n=1 Tax=Sandarakinorhabdus glacialis TaxID=1614636 RepID=A0A916ZMW0_9SPHN|nr:DUF1345 domain-containing protein [Polymorphobacter glacialis]GGE03466.1 membrane protein [Polymorphobacter glacialis]